MGRWGTVLWSAGASLAVGCQAPVDGTGILIAAPSANEYDDAVEDARGYLERIGDGPVDDVRLDDLQWDELEAAAADGNAGLVLVLGAAGLLEVDPTALGMSDFVLQVEDRGDWRNPLTDRGATFVLTGGAQRLSEGYAAYEALRRLGVRFYHPQDEYVPRPPRAALRELARTPTVLDRGDAVYRPDFAWRSWSFHSAHPLEHLEAFSDGDHPIDEAAAVERWIVKNKGNRFKELGRGIASDEARARRAVELDELRERLGFPRGTGITLHNEQQGASAEIDPSSATPVREQIESLVARKLEEVPDAAWFGIHFGPTEFTTTPDQQTVEWIDWAGRKALELRPDIRVEVNVHVTGGQPSPNYDDLGCANRTNDAGRSDYYDLAFHTDPRLGLQVHTVMFYPLEGPAHVYNQRSFEHKLCLMRRASAEGRPLSWFPEGAWWLSFDNPVPVYLPLYIASRDRDIDLLAPLLRRNGGTLDGHRMFNSGQEWGYWQQDYAVGLKAWNTEISIADVLGEILDPLCPAGLERDCEAKATATEVLLDVMEHQREFFLERSDWKGRPGGLYTYFAGEDPADEIAAASGLEFRPVRVSFQTIVSSWRDDDIAHFRETDLAALAEARDRYANWGAEMAELRVPEESSRWLAEIVDGLRIDELRAEHTHALYDAVLRYREAQRADADPIEAATEAWMRAERALEAAREVVDDREAAYRYPAEQTHGGGLTEDTAVDNGTTYPYRVHTKTHLLTYWTGRHEQVEVLMNGGTLGASASVRMTNALAPVGETLQIDWPDDVEGTIAIGSLSVDPSVAELQLGSQPGHWEVAGSLVSDGRDVEVAGGVVRSDRSAHTPAQAITLVEPAEPAAQAVLSSVFPALRWAWVEDDSGIAFGTDPEDDGIVDFAAVTFGAFASFDGTSFETEAVSFAIPVSLSSGGDALGIGVTGAVLSGRVDDRLLDPITIAGSISVDDLISALVDLAGFDEEGATATLSGILDFDPADPPTTVPFVATLTVD